MACHLSTTRRKKNDCILDWTIPWGSVRVGVMPDDSAQKLADNLAHAETVDDFDQAAREALQSFDQLGEQIIAKTGVKLACGAGCSVCCSLRVDVFAHEVFLVAHYILSHFSPEEMTELKGRLAAHVERVLPLTPFEHAT